MTLGTWLCADPLRCALPKAETHQVCLGPDLPWTQSRTLPRTGEDPAPCYLDCTARLPRGKRGTDTQVKEVHSSKHSEVKIRKQRQRNANTELDMTMKKEAQKQKFINLLKQSGSTISFTLN